MKKFRLAVLISGRGSNLQALIDACRNPAYPAEIAVVISNSPEAQGLARAADAGLQAMIVDHTYFKGDKAAFEAALTTVIEQHEVDLVCLAGFMRLLSADFLNRFKDKVINIHPSLLPKHKGFNTHTAAIKAGDKVHGCTVHVVTPGMDEGPVIAQAEVKIKRNDTADSLAARVLAEEHVLYPDVVRKIAVGDIVIRDGQIESKAAIRHHSEVKKESEKAPAMSQAHHTTEASPEAVRHSQDLWNAFTKGTLYAGGAIAVVLVLMAIFLV